MVPQRACRHAARGIRGGFLWQSRRLTHVDLPCGSKMQESLPTPGERSRGLAAEQADQGKLLRLGIGDSQRGHNQLVYTRRLNLAEPRRDGSFRT